VPERTVQFRPILGALEAKKPRDVQGFSRRVSEGTRTPDRLDHNQELYQLSYAHQEPRSLAVVRRLALVAPASRQATGRREIL
jgi:hypothetical protein